MGTLMATFHVGEFLCAVPAADVQEVLLDKPRTPVPGSSRYIAGLMNLRGQVVSVLDLSRRMGLVRTGSEPAASMSVVVRWDGEVWSLLVDRVGDVLDIPDEQFERPPKTLTGAMREMIVGAYKLDDGLVLLLNTKAVLSLDEAAA